MRLGSIALTFVALIILGGCGTSGRSTSNEAGIQIPTEGTWGVRMAESFMVRQPESIEYPGTKQKWNYEQGVMYEALRQLHESTRDERYAAYIQHILDTFIQPDGSIKTYDYESFNIDLIPMGRALLFMHERTKQERYRVAADQLRTQLANHPRTNEGGFWHKKIYPYQMWLDGLYMGQPFYLRYALKAVDSAALEDIVNQFVWMERHSRDEKTGLLYHAWDESKSQRWCDPATGKSRHFWSRAIGWYAMALVDVLDLYPVQHPRRQELVEILRRLIPAVMSVRDERSKTWYQVLDQGTREGNYLESSGTAMFVYAMAKGVRLELLDESYRGIAQESFDGMVKQFVTVDAEGMVNLHDACQGAGLGGNPYRDGSYEYYISEKRRTNDFKAVGPFIMAAVELGL